eukprot:5732586-Pleurochrysis_carterae.AAC.1
MSITPSTRQCPTLPFSPKPPKMLLLIPWHLSTFHRLHWGFAQTPSFVSVNRYVGSTAMLGNMGYGDMNELFTKVRAVYVLYLAST